MGFFVGFNAGSMIIKSFFERPFGLADIIKKAFVAVYDIDNVRSVAGKSRRGRNNEIFKCG